MTAKEMRAKRKALADQAQALLDKAEAEKRSLTAEEGTTFDKIHADIDVLKVDVERAEKQENEQRFLAASQGTVAGKQDTDSSKESRTVAGAKDAQGLPTDPKERDQLEMEAFRTWVRFGREGLEQAPVEYRTIMNQRVFRPAANSPEARALSVGTTTAGGFTVPQGFSNNLEEALKAFSGMRQAPTNQMTTGTGQDIPWPTENETAVVGELLAENVAAAAADVTFGQVTLKAYKYSSKLVLVSIELLQDSAFNLNTHLAKVLGTRIGRITNTHFTVGTGTGQPQGVVTFATSGKVGIVGQTVSVIYDDLVDLIHSIDPAYRTDPSCGFMFHDTTLKALKKIKDTTGRPLWAPGLVTREPDTICGYPYWINQDVAVMAANAKSMLFGPMSKYIIRNVMDVTLMRLVERYAEFGQVGFLAFARMDGRGIDAGTNPIKYYANSAT